MNSHHASPLVKETLAPPMRARPPCLQSHSITLKLRLTVVSYERTRLSSVSATYTLLNLIDAAVDEALMPIKRYLYFLKATPV